MRIERNTENYKLAVNNGMKITSLEQDNKLLEDKNKTLRDEVEQLKKS